MKTKTHIYFLIMIAIICIPNWVLADSSTDQLKTLFEVKLKQVRQDPLGTMQTYGIDLESIRIRFPEYYTQFEKGMVPLVVSEALLISAKLHTVDMLMNNYFSDTSKDGSTFKDRIVNSGFIADITGESLAMVAFTNFMRPDEAVAHLFRKMVQTAFSTEDMLFRSFFNPDFQEYGLGIGTGKILVGKANYNVYIITCDLGKRGYTAAQPGKDILVNLINQLRVKPLLVYESIGIDKETILQINPVYNDVFINGVPPLATNEILNRVAQSHTEDMFMQHYFSMTSLQDEMTPFDRVANAGYAPSVVREVLGKIRVEIFGSPGEAAYKIFKQLLVDELDRIENGDPILLESRISEVGIGMGFDKIGDNDASSSTYGYLVTIDFGNREDYTGNDIIGVVFQDINNDTLYSPGEEVAQEPIDLAQFNFFQGFKIIENKRTNWGGGFIFQNKIGLFKITNSNGIESDVRMKKGNVFLWMDTRQNAYF